MRTEATPGDNATAPGAADATSTTSTRPDGSGDSTTERFVTFHEANPAVYAELVALCREFARATGRRRFGIRQPWERLRWNLAVRTTRPESEPKLNDLYLPFYARLIARTEPDLAGLFETRRAPEADAWAETLPAPRTAADHHGGAA